MRFFLTSCFLFTGAFALTNAQTIPASLPSNEAVAQPNPPATNITIAPTAPTQVDPFGDPLIKQVHARYEKALNGDTKETRALTSDLEKWTGERPTNYLLKAYLGSVYTLDSRDAWPGPGKLTYLRKGGQWLDGAVASAPDNPAIRFVRAIDYYELPFFFGKGKTAHDDFEILVKQIDGEVNTPYVLSIETQQAIYYYAGLSAEQMSDRKRAKALWLKGYLLQPKSELGVKMWIEQNAKN